MTSVCVKCALEMPVEKNGVLLVKMASCGPIECLLVDSRTCPECKLEVISWATAKPVAFGTKACESFVRGAKNRGERVIEYWLNRSEQQKGVVPE
jgi:hypothetical protein